MRKGSHYLKLSFVILLCLVLTGCVATAPKGFLQPSDDYLRHRQLQIRQYDTKDEKQIIIAVAEVLQDLGFTLGESEIELGLVSASKKADAKHAGQIAGAVVIDILSGISGSKSNATAGCDKTQVVKACVIVMPSQNSERTIVRVTFQRIVWNMNNQISRVESIKLPEIYQKFYESLSKAIFLEANQI